MIKIEKGVEMPKGRQGRKQIYPWDDMEVGDSFKVQGKSQKDLSPSASFAGKRRGKKFSARNVDGGVRVWRVE